VNLVESEVETAAARLNWKWKCGFSEETVVKPLQGTIKGMKKTVYGPSFFYPACCG